MLQPSSWSLEKRSMLIEEGGRGRRMVGDGDGFGGGGGGGGGEVVVGRKEEGLFFRSARPTEAAYTVPAAAVMMSADMAWLSCPARLFSGS